MCTARTFPRDISIESIKLNKSQSNSTLFDDQYLLTNNRVTKLGYVIIIQKMFLSIKLQGSVLKVSETTQSYACKITKITLKPTRDQA